MHRARTYSRFQAQPSFPTWSPMSKLHASPHPSTPTSSNPLARLWTSRNFLVIATRAHSWACALRRSEHRRSQHQATMEVTADIFGFMLPSRIVCSIPLLCFRLSDNISIEVVIGPGAHYTNQQC
mmetsp:Transcript_112783/g.291579  ORF Transcript_112783/g.291579 Transcript_112783/m.291579 type:complete len:125 (-) Transcript_112783:39-413(-)